MPDAVTKKPRKISCLPCRNKKARCDEQHPYCSRCIRNNREHLCIYPKPRTFGRPPKNAVFHKNKDLITTTSTKSSTSASSPSSSSSASSNSIQCREFIFENQNIFLSNYNQQLRTNNMYVPQRFIKYNNQILDIERIFSLYVSRGITLRQKLTNYETIPHFKLRSLNQVHTWLTSSMVNITIKRSCQFINIRSFYDPELSMNAFMKPEHMKAFFFNSHIAQQSSNSSPLKSIPTEQAVKLIDYFFQMHPYHILLNKTKLLHDYWNDSVEPLLLCVIYGIATYTCQQNMGTSSNKIWDTDRNPFLNYAYILMEEFFLKRDNNHSTSPSSLGNYQASVIMGIFEILFGLPKHGMTIISLSYMMAADLGIFRHNARITDGVINSENVGKQTGTRTIDALDPVDRELLINTYWAALRVTAYGCLELGLYLRDTLLLHGQPFPAANASTSASYQYDKSNKNESTTAPFLIESFHTEMVITYFSSKLFACLPKTEYNVFGCKTYPPPEQSHLQGQRVLLQLLQTAAFSSPSFDSVVDSKIQTVLNDFSDFIMQEKYQWSFQQCYIVETTYYLYCIHFSFIKSSNTVDPIRYQQISSDLDLSNPQVGARVANLQPTTLLLINLMQHFLIEIEEKNLYDDAKTEEQKNPSTGLVPFALMSTALETMAQLTICHYNLGTSPASIHDQITSVYHLIKHPIFWAPQQQAATKLIYKSFKEFLKSNQIHIDKQQPPQPPPPQQPVDVNYSMPLMFLNQNQWQPYDLDLSSLNFTSIPPTESFFLQDFNDLFDGIY